MLLSNPYFWLGELGLFLSIVSCAVLLHGVRHKSWLTILPLFAALVFSLAMFVRPAIYGAGHTIPPMPYLYRLAIGAVLTSWAWSVRAKSITQDRLRIDKIVKWVSVSLGLLVLFIIYRLRHLGR